MLPASYQALPGPGTVSSVQNGETNMSSVPGVSQKDTTLTKLFVGGLPYNTTDKSLREHFEIHGEIDEAVVITDRATGKSKGYGFVSPLFFHFFLSRGDQKWGRWQHLMQVLALSGRISWDGKKKYYRCKSTLQGGGIVMSTVMRTLNKLTKSVASEQLRISFDQFKVHWIKRPCFCQFPWRD